MATDEEIVASVRQGRRERFQELVERYRPALFQLALSRLGRGDWAEDAVQETFYHAFRSLHTFNPKFSFRTWLWTIQLNQCRRHIKRLQRWSTLQHTDEHPSERFAELATREPAPEQHAEAAEQLQQLEQALHSLPQTQADALRLRFFGDLKFQEIADIQGCSLRTAKARVKSGLVSLGKLPELQSRSVPDGEHASETRSSVTTCSNPRPLPKQN